MGLEDRLIDKSLVVRYEAKLRSHFLLSRRFKGIVRLCTVKTSVEELRLIQSRYIARIVFSKEVAARDLITLYRRSFKGRRLSVFFDCHYITD